MNDDKDLICKEWRLKAYQCRKRSGLEHAWIITASIITPQSKHATVLTCGACYHTINLTDAHHFKESIVAEPSFLKTDNTLK